MTTLSIVAGLIPTALGIGAGSAQRSAVAVTIIGGQTLCLLPTLLVTPVAYSLLAETEARSGYAILARVVPWLVGRRAGLAVPDPPTLPGSQPPVA
jgi:HAE1 family hydrophobic/amphiphilic exporter-1